MKQDVEFLENEDFLIIKLIDNDEPVYILDKVIEPGDKPTHIGLTKTGELRIREIDYPKTMYHESNVRETADKIRERFKQEGCKPCTVLSETGNTEQTFVLPTLRQAVNQFLSNLP